MAGANVPEFGIWEEKAIQFTKSFEDARKDRVAGFNPNDPVMNPQAFMQSQPIQEQGISRKNQQKSSSMMAVHIDPPRHSTAKMESHSDVHQKSPSLPKFGGWDESRQKVEYTVIFNEVKEKKHTAAIKLPAVPANASGSKNKKDNQKTSSKARE